MNIRNESDTEEILKQIKSALSERPPTIGVIGISGTGKSSTINSMFQLRRHVSHTVRGTVEFESTDVMVDVKQGDAAGEEAILRIVDAPGLGEDVRKDDEYLAMYTEELPKCDVLLWVSNARNRATALEQRYLSELKGSHEKIVFGLNQIDLVEPMNWNDQTNMPSDEQSANVQDIVADRKERFEFVTGKKIVFVPYTAKYFFGLMPLYQELITSCQSERKWMFEIFRAFSPKNWLELAKGLTEKEKQQIIEECG